MMTPRVLTLADFAPHRGRPFAVEAPSGPISLVLAEVQELPASVREGGSFRLEFEGPHLPPLGQGTYRFLVDGRPTEIFIVPISQNPSGIRYEAIFF